MQSIHDPLTIDTADDEASESFLWVETPWPWEGGGLLICGIMKKDCNIRLISKPGSKNRPDHHESVRQPDGEIGASLRYLSQRFSMPNRKIMGVLNDIGTEELAHLEIVSTIVHQLTRGLSVEEIEKSVWHRIMWIIP